MSGEMEPLDLPAGAQAEGRVNRLAVWEGVLSIVVNTVLFALKYWVGLQTASIAIIADAWHTLFDSFTSLVVLWGAKSSARPPDKKHPFGHGRIELIASIIIGAVLAMVGVNFLVESAKRLVNGETATYGSAAIFVFALSVIIKEAIAQFSIRAGRKTNARSLTADGWHHRSDALASGFILAGILLGRYFWWIDGVLGIAVSLVIFWATFDILRISISSLIGEEPDAELIRKLRAVVAESVPFQVDLHHLHLHQYGNHRELTCHIYLPQDLSLAESHRIATALESRIKEQFDMETTIHVEPRTEETAAR